ncbi:class I SAM-dependent DNA methyltransferase [Leuconostoc mesenteroides]|uniref:class I SAM-dependent DNA methyltransferase n=1 Tax=Leuconostoc mesenteroides TaxID=1245 RepID=UPI002362C3CC|nr:DNA methyltransferase [Leuconostoc mesenteroides]
MAKSKILNITEIEDSLKNIIKHLDKKNFITEFLELYDVPKISVTRAKSKFDEGEPFAIKNKLYYIEEEGDVVSTIDTIEHKLQEQKSTPRYIIVNNFTSIAAIDTETSATLNIHLEELPAKADFFLAWNGIEKADYQNEITADRKAAERFAKLYDAIAKDNPSADEHDFNLFLIRVLFLLFAEDTGIMTKGAFTNILKTRTAEDGSNFNVVIKELFEILNVNPINRDKKAQWLLKFPYVNGNLFGESHVNLIFTQISRELLIEAGELLNWNEINPDILGAMIQSVASTEDRQVTGMHYTSVPNIMRVINPLFLDELNNAFEDLKKRYDENEVKQITYKTRQENKKAILKKLNELHERISTIKFLDPASGSGNFLIITYKEIRRLEIKIMLLEQKIEKTDQIPMSVISLSQFNGMEIDDFAHEVAKIALWIAEHQMNEEMKSAIPGTIAELLPLKDAGNIICGNSLRMNWEEVVPHSDNDEVYIMGNPPYIGGKKMGKTQKQDSELLFGNLIGNWKSMDYIAGWFYLGGKYIQNSNGKLAFVSTNSFNQGEQVSMLWPKLLVNLKIDFAYPSFKWSNSAKGQAAVIVEIVGLSDKGLVTDRPKIYYEEGTFKEVSHISPYLIEGNDTIVRKASNPISKIPKMDLGSMPKDGGNFVVDENEYKIQTAKNPLLKTIIRPYLGSKEYINNEPRYVIWLPTYEQYKKYSTIAFIEERIKKVEIFRLNSDAESTRKAAKYSYAFKQKGNQVKADKAGINANIIAPRVSSINREYIPFGYVDGNTIVSDSANVIFGAPVWLLGLIESRMHMTWVRAVGGRLKTDYRYSSNVVYNTFPVSMLSTQRKNEMARVMTEILDLREYEGGNLAELYNKDTMPKSLRQKHKELDGIVDRSYQQRSFESDEERLSTLLKLYQEMTSNNE